MNSGDWSKIETICLKALSLGKKDRKTFVEETCGDDKNLLNEVNSLLSQASRESPFLDQPLVHISSFDTTASDSSIKESTVGPYRLIREIGTGGMGKVYLAARNDNHFDQYAAIKIIRNDLVSDDAVRRFHAERQILASLNHPNIARLFDGGTTKEGMPWFAMEYLEGVSVTQYCDKQKSTVRQRLELFLQICSAVQYAHQNLIIHRDLKPGNILVTTDGIPKLLDFGIAKILDDGHYPGRFKTRQKIMTTEYASPEQIRGENISTASDVYSLGLILFELLTGTLPFDFEGKSQVQINEILTKTTPAKPSECITPDEVNVAVCRSTTPDKLKKVLTGDLDAILQKALRNTAGERYTMVDQFSRDIGRYLNGLPVLARRGNFVYQTRKFLIRNRWSAAISALVAFLIISFGFFSLHQASVIETRSVELEKQKDRAEAVSSFLSGLFQSADPSDADNASITALELLERGVERVDEELADQPAFQSDLYFVISDVYEKIGLYEESEILAEKALHGWLKDPVYYQQEIAKTWNRLGWIHFQQGKFASSDSLMNLALNRQRSLANTDPLDLARTLNDLAVLNQALGNYARTDSLLHEALDIRMRLLGGDHESVGVVLSNIAALRWRMGDLDGAEKQMKESVSIFRQIDLYDMRTAIAMTNLAAILTTKGELEQAETLYRDALNIRLRLVGENHPDVANSFAHLGNLLRYNGKFSEAEEMLLKAYELRKQLLGEQHNLIGDSRRTLGLLYFDMKNYSKALSYYADAISLFREILPEGHIDLSEVLFLAGNLYLKTGDWELAEEAYREVLAIRQNHYGERDLRSIEVLIQLGITHKSLNRLNMAEVTLAESLKLLAGADSTGKRYKELKTKAEAEFASIK